jgi:hypothetical protein
MKQFTLFETLTGKILCSGDCGDDELDAQAYGMYSVIEGRCEPAACYVSQGNLYSKPPKPTSNHSFDYSTKQWIDPRSLQELRDAKWDFIKKAREAERYSLLTTSHGVFDATAKDQKGITDAVMLAQTMQSMGNSISIDFTLADNSTVSLDTPAMVEVGLALGQRTQEGMARGRLLRTQIYEASASELDAITW